MSGRPTVVRSREWFFEVCLPRMVSQSSDCSLLEFATKIAKEAFSAQADHIKALEKREEAMSDIFHKIAQECTTCEIAKQAKALLGER